MDIVANLIGIEIRNLEITSSGGDLNSVRIGESITLAGWVHNRGKVGTLNKIELYIGPEDAALADCIVLTMNFVPGINGGRSTRLERTIPVTTQYLNYSTGYLSGRPFTLRRIRVTGSNSTRYADFTDLGVFYTFYDDWLRPSFASGAPQITDLNTTAASVIGALVQSQSRLQFTFRREDVILDSRAELHPLTFNVAIRDYGGAIVYQDAVVLGTDQSETTLAMPAPFAGSGVMGIVATVAAHEGTTGQYSTLKTVLAYSLPFIANLNILRYEPYIDDAGATQYRESDDSEHVWLTMDGRVTALNGNNAWTLDYSTSEDFSNPIPIASAADGQTITYTENRAVIPAVFSAMEKHEFYVRLQDQFGYAAAYSVIQSAEGPLHIAPHGVCAGGVSKGTAGNPMFESYYPGSFYNGIEGVNIYRTGEVKTGGRWTDGRPIYRQLVNFGMVVNNGSVSVPLNTGPLASLVRIWGAGRRDQELRPIPLVGAALAYLTGVAVSGFDTEDPQVYIIAGSDGGFHEAWCILEYTKAADLQQTSLLMDADGAALVDSNGLMLAAAGSETYTLMHTGAQVDTAVTQAMEMYMAFANGELKGDPGLGIVNVTITEVV